MFTQILKEYLTEIHSFFVDFSQTEANRGRRLNGPFTSQNPCPLRHPRCQTQQAALNHGCLMGLQLWHWL